MKQFLRKLLIGDKFILSVADYKYAMLRGEYALILICICLFYILLDSFNGVFYFHYYYIVGIVSGLAIIHLNRVEHYKWSTGILIAVTNTVVFLFADADHPAGGVYFFYVTCSIANLVLIGHLHPVAGWLSALLPIGLGFGSYLFNTGVVPKPLFRQDMLSINFLSNFTIGILSSIFTIQFLIRRNRSAERSLLESERHLMHASQELKRSEERFQLALEGTRAGIYEWDIASNHIYVSNYWKTLLGYAPDEPIQISIEAYLDMLHPEDRTRTESTMQKVLADQRSYQNELRLRTRSGHYNWFLDSGIIKADEKGKPILAVGSLIDIEERKAGEEKIILQNELLAKANRELDHFVYSVSHDLRAPLSSILGLTNIYNLTKDAAERESIVKMISERAYVLDDFIREVLDYSRNARTDLKYQSLRVRSLVGEVLEGLQHMNGIDEVKIENEVNPDLVVTSDQERLKVLLSNLLTNSVNYRDTSKSPYIRITSAQQNGHWSFAVEDNGVGIKKEHQHRIFEMFYKAHDKGHGTGLGLYIVQESLHRMKGTVEVESTYGAGSTFRITLPMHPTHP